MLYNPMWPQVKKQEKILKANLKEDPHQQVHQQYKFTSGQCTHLAILSFTVMN